jgi:hypothetical protein
MRRLAGGRPDTAGRLRRWAKPGSSPAPAGGRAVGRKVDRSSQRVEGTTASLLFGAGQPAPVNVTSSQALAAGSSSRGLRRGRDNGTIAQTGSSSSAPAPATRNNSDEVDCGRTRARNRPCSGSGPARKGARLARRPDRQPGTSWPGAQAPDPPAPGIPAQPTRPPPSLRTEAPRRSAGRGNGIPSSAARSPDVVSAQPWHASREARRDRTSFGRGVAGSGPRARLALPQGRRSSHGKLRSHAPFRRCKAGFGRLTNGRP